MKKEKFVDDNDVKVMLSLGYHVKLCLGINTATQIMKLLGKENVLLHGSNYKDGTSTPYLKPWGTEEISVSFISPANYLVWTAEGDKLCEK